MRLPARTIAPALAAIALAAQARAQEPTRFSWLSAGGGIWSLGTNWSNDQTSGTPPLPDGHADYELSFGLGGAYTATHDLNAGFLLNRLSFEGAEVTLDGSSVRFASSGAILPTIAQQGPAPATARIHAPIGLLADLTFTGSGSAEVVVAGPITGAGGITVAASGPVTFEGANTYAGDTRVVSGSLSLAQPNDFNDSSTVEIASGATLVLDFPGTEIVGALVLDGVVQPDGSYDAANAGPAIQGTGSLQVVTPPSSSDPRLASLTLEGGALSPAFQPAIGAYSTSVPHDVTGTRLTATVAAAGSLVTINGSPAAAGVPSDPVPLAVGPNLITLEVTAPDGLTSRIYTATVHRASGATVVTGGPVVVDASSATLNGTAQPGGFATVFFEWGPTPAYGNRTPDRDVAGTTERPFAESLNGLEGARTYHYRAVLVDAAGTLHGADRRFTTPPAPPVAATGAPSEVTASTATFVGAVNPRGVDASAYFEYGLTTAYGRSTPVQSIPAGFGLVPVQAVDVDLIPNATYHCRIVASNAAGTVFGEDVVFKVEAGGGSGSGSATAVPQVAVDDATGVGTESAVLRGSVNPNSGPTVVRFQYGPGPGFGQQSAGVGIGNGDSPAAVAVPIEGLLPDTTYHYRLIASNQLGESASESRSFTTDPSPPTAVTGDSAALSTTSVRLEGAVRARGGTAEVWFDYGTDGLSFDSIRAVPGVAAEGPATPVTVDLVDLAQGVLYYYRVRAVGPGGQALGATRTFDVASLSGLIHQFPPGVPPGDRLGSVEVVLEPAGIASGWHFAGEQLWRASGESATGLTAGDRIIEYRPVPGYLKPPNEVVSVESGPAATPLTRTYVGSGATGSGNLTVFLKPQNLTEGLAPARWRFFGEGDAAWRESGTTVTGLVPGDHVILSKPVAGRSTPPPATVAVSDGGESSLTLTYYVAEEEIGTPPGVLDFAVVSGDTSLPYAHVGQLRSDVGTGSGVVVRPQVMVTVAHAIFDDGSLAVVGGLQWLFQRDRGIHDPLPLIPRGHYLLTGYAAQRLADNSPGESSPASQNLDVATAYFGEPAGRTGFSGFLASDTLTNEFLTSDAPKTLVGYPVDGIPEANIGRMHATPPAPVTFTKAFDRTYTTSDIRASGGASGGPLCLPDESGVFYPAAIYLGGTAQTVVRAFDSDVVNLIGLAEASAQDAAGLAGGGTVSATTEAYADPTLGALRVAIEPASARVAGAGWRISSLAPYLDSGARIDGLGPGSYQVTFPLLEGFVPPAPQPVLLEAGQLTALTFAYEEIVPAPTLTSPTVAQGTAGAPFSYQITSDPSPMLFSIRGRLPAGLAFDPGSGLISGTLAEAGVFRVDVGASSSGGSDSRELTITSLPAISPAELAVPYLQPISYAIPSGPNGSGLEWAASGLPAGLVLDPATGVVTGTPPVPGVFPVEVTLTRLGASASAELTLTVTGVAPEITLQPDPARSIRYGTTTTLRVAATGLPAPELQWYRGPVGNTDDPVEGATSEVFKTPPLTVDTLFWVRASSISGTADSEATQVHILPSGNANLVDLLVSEGTLSPSFNLGIRWYSLDLPHEVSSLVLSPVVEVEQSTVTIQGVPLPADANSAPLALPEGRSVVRIDVTSGDGATTQRYTLIVDRAPPPSVETRPATEVSDNAAVVTGVIVPNGTGTGFFQYGTSTAYGSATPGTGVSGASPVGVGLPIFGLEADTTYHYRIGLTTRAGTIFGDDMTFTTAPAPPLVATGLPLEVSGSSARFVGAVNPNGSATSVRFEWGETEAYGNLSPVEAVPAGDTVVDIGFVTDTLVPGTIYHYRLVGTSAVGTSYGEDVSFVAGEASGGGSPASPPLATTLDPVSVTADAAVLQAAVNPQGGTTFVGFQYGLGTGYGKATPPVGIGSGTDPINVVREIAGLLPGMTYHCRAVASNSQGVVYGEDVTFETTAAAPLVVTGTATPASTDSVRLRGQVRPSGAPAAVFFEYGTDGLTLPNRVQASPATVDGSDPVDIEFILPNPEIGPVYQYRLVAVLESDPTVEGTGEVRTFLGADLVGQLQRFPRELDPGENLGQLRVNLTPADIGAWRLEGEKEWRRTGGTVTGMATGDRVIEYRPAEGFLQPAREPVGIVSGEPIVVLDREYLPTLTPGTAALRVELEPASQVTADPIFLRPQWRLLGAGNAAWKDSGSTLEGLMPGRYLIESKRVQGLDAPTPTPLVLEGGELTTLAIAYLPALDSPAGVVLTPSFEDITTNRTQPYAFGGQLRSDRGAYSGCVVRPRVVGSVAQALFDEATLAQVPGIQWLFQRSRNFHEPAPMIPRGFYLFGDYAFQRELEGTPGVLSPEAQSLNVASLYFLQDAGRTGYSGVWTTSPLASPLLDDAPPKVLFGYPERGATWTSRHGVMTAVQPPALGFRELPGGVFETSEVLGLTGMLGGPLCIRRDGGNYYPVALYLGGDAAQNYVRAIDAPVVELFSRAERTANTGENNTSGGISQTSYTAFSTTATQGSLTVVLEPAEARAIGALWRIGTTTGYLLSGSRRNGLSPGAYPLEFTTVPGFQSPSAPSATVVAGNLTTITYTYQPELSALATWREANFATTSNVGGASDGEDPDGDGRLNIEEFIAGTDPNDRNDYLKIEAASLSGAGYAATVSGRAGRIYTLQRSVDPVADTWLDVVTIGPLAVDGELVLTDPALGATYGVYRVAVIHSGS